MAEIDIHPGLGELTLTGDRIAELRAKIQRLYAQDQRPWVIGYSGGKDSTTVVQLVWDSLAELAEREPLKKPVYVLSSDTRVETPVVVDELQRNLSLMESAARDKGLPFSANLVVPPPDQSFWVNMIGRGYPTPTKTFRWCTDRLKIQPANQFILDRVSDFGEVVLVLGVRKDESATRNQSIMLHEKRSAEPDFSLHSSLPGALVFSPIVDWTTRDVWSFLGSAVPPWGGSHRRLITMYRNAQAGECPLVVDKTTSSCGNSRFGCWTCTVVTADRSMEAMADASDGSGEWLLPLLELREFLAKTAVPKDKGKFRQVRRRDGSIRFRDKKSSTLIWGPYKPHVRVEILRRLLKAEAAVQSDGPDEALQLISDEELLRIQEVWGQEPDPEFLTLNIAEIVRGESSRSIKWPQSDDHLMGTIEKQAMLSASKAAGVPREILGRLLRIEEAAQFKAKRMGLREKLLTAISASWADEEDVLRERAQRAEAESADSGSDDVAPAEELDATS